MSERIYPQDRYPEDRAVPPGGGILLAALASAFGQITAVVSWVFGGTFGSALCVWLVVTLGLYVAWIVAEVGRAGMERRASRSPYCACAFCGARGHV